jgi:outer membrane protein assembly factor BamB
MAAMKNIMIVGIGGKVIGLDAMSGEIRWEDGMKSGGYGEVALAATEDLVFASANSAKLFCYRYATGALVWTADTNTTGRATIIVDEEQVYVAKGGVVDCYSFSGTKVWSQPLKGKGLGRIAMGFPGNIVQSDDPGTE